MKRRALLRGLAGVTVATPFLASLGKRSLAQAVDPKRLVVFFTPAGVNVRDFWPTVDRGALTASSMMGRGVEPLARHVDKLLFVRGLQSSPLREYTLQHEMGFASKLTATDLGSGPRHLAQGPSVDYVAAKSVHADGAEPLALQVGSIVSENVGTVPRLRFLEGSQSTARWRESAVQRLPSPDEYRSGFHPGRHDQSASAEHRGRSSRGFGEPSAGSAES